MATPTYAHRLGVEGTVLAGSGTLGSVVVLALSPQATRAPASTLGQLAVASVLLFWLGPRGVRRAIAESHELPVGAVGTGEPTPLWHIVSIVAGLSILAGELAGWDAGLRVTGGCVLVGCVQALILKTAVHRTERSLNRTFYRVPGSRILRGTRLGYVQVNR